VRGEARSPRWLKHCKELGWLQWWTLLKARCLTPVPAVGLGADGFVKERDSFCRANLPVRDFCERILAERRNVPLPRLGELDIPPPI